MIDRKNSQERLRRNSGGWVPPEFLPRFLCNFFWLYLFAIKQKKEMLFSISLRILTCVVPLSVRDNSISNLLVCVINVHRWVFNVFEPQTSSISNTPNRVGLSCLSKLKPLV